MHEEPAVELLPVGVQVRLKAGGLKGAIVAVVEAEAAYDVAMADSAKTERVAHAEVTLTLPFTVTAHRSPLTSHLSPFTLTLTRTPNPNPDPDPNPNPNPQPYP